MQAPDSRRATVAPNGKTRVLIVDDSAFVRRVLRRMLNSDPDIEVVGEAPDPFVARELIISLAPDVLTLDVEMPRMDGITFLRKLMQYRPLPVVVISSLTTKGSKSAVEAYAAGAVEVIAKPASSSVREAMREDLIQAVKTAARTQVRKVMSLKPPTVAPRKVGTTNGRQPLVAIGASTGGTIAIEAVLRGLPEDVPPVVIVQHMPPVFTEAFARRLNGLGGVRVREAKEGDLCEPGLALIAPGGRHMVLKKGPLGYVVSTYEGPRVSGYIPSVDVLFESIAQNVGPNAIGVLLTGMGSDGAQGLLKMRTAGAKTIGQNEESCVVYGMPKVAAKIGATNELVALKKIPQRILELINN